MTCSFYTIPLFPSCKVNETNFLLYLEPASDYVSEPRLWSLPSKAPKHTGIFLESTAMCSGTQSDFFPPRLTPGFIYCFLDS